MIHRGEIIEQAVRESGMSITKLAIRMGRSRRHIYNLFETVDVPLEVILEIGKIINHDFTYLLPASSVSYSEKISLSAQGVESSVVNSSEIDYWKNKYLDLLEKYNKILESRI